jgi:hypothetical protein
VDDGRQCAPGGAPPRPEDVLASGRIEMVSTAQLRGGLSPRVNGIDQDHVRALMEVESSLPPLLVHEPTMTVIDGLHRLEAARRRGAEHIESVLLSGARSDAFVIAVHANVSHGKPLTLGERRAAAKVILADFPECSDRWLASVCGLSPSTVRGVRAANAQSSRDNGSTRVGRDGRRRPVDRGGLPVRVAEAVASNPGASVRGIAVVVGASPSTVLGHVRRLRAGGPPVSKGQDPKSTSVAPAAVVEGRDAAIMAVPELASSLGWLERTSIGEADWQTFVRVVPLGRIYEFADECRRRAVAWSAVASALERRAGRRK